MVVESSRRPTVVLLTRLLLGAQGVLWIVFALLYAAGRVARHGMTGPTLVMVTALLVANAAVFIAGSILLPRLGQMLRVLLAAFVGLNAALSLADQVGLSDLLVFVADIGTLALVLLLSRRRRRTPGAG